LTYVVNAFLKLRYLIFKIRDITFLKIRDLFLGSELLYELVYMLRHSI